MNYLDEKKLEVMKMVVDGEKLEENENIKISEVLVQLKAEPYIRTTHPTQPRSNILVKNFKWTQAYI